MSDQSNIAAQMIQALSVVEPDLDTSIGTTVRNVIDVEAEQIAQAYADNNLAQYQYDVDTLTGSALDAFCGNFGFQRFAAQTATGVATFTQVSSSTQLPPVTIPAGTLVSTATSITFQTVATYTMVPIINQNNSIDIPIQATVGGSNTNVTSGSINSFSTPISGINSVTNQSATSGGTDAESDAAFRQRFKTTLFRSFTGTAASFLGVATDNPAVTAANVMGSVVTHQEQVTLTGGTPTATSILTDVGFVYPNNQYMAFDLSESTSTAVTGSFLLGGGGLSNGSTYGTIVSQTPVTLSAGTLMSFGASLAVVSSNVSGVTSIPVDTFVAPGNYSVGFTVDWIYNSGAFLTPNIDFGITTQALLATPTTAPTLAASGSGSGFGAGTIYYKYAFANFNGLTGVSSEANVTVTAGQNVGVTIPAFPGTYPAGIGPSLYTFIYRSLTTGTEQLVAVIPSSTTTWSDTGSVVPYGTMPSSNTTGTTVVITGESANVTDSTYQVQFDYIPATSRNNFSAGVLNCVDLYVAGQSPQQANQTFEFYMGPQNTNAGQTAPTGLVQIGMNLTQNSTYTSITMASPVTLPVGTLMYVGGFVPPAIVNVPINNSTTVPINSWVCPASAISGAYMYVDTLRFNGFPASPLFVGNFQRADGTLPQIYNRLIPLSFGPVTGLPATLTSPSGSGVNNVSPATYNLGSNYWIVNQAGTAGMSNQSLCGIEWPNNQVWGQNFNAGSSGSPTNYGLPSPMSVNYSFNSVPLSVYQAMQQWRLLSHDVMVHQAYPLLINVSLVCVFAAGTVASTIQTQINSAIEAAFTNVSFNQVLEASQILAAVLGVNGVLNARFALSGDGLTGSGIQSVTASGSVIETYINGSNQVTDISFTNTTYPVFNQTYIKSVAQNAFVSSSPFIQPL